MQYNSHATNQDCVSEILTITNATVASYPLVDITRRFNGALDRFFTLAFQADGRWSFDDLNQTTAPIESINITSGTEKYALDTFASEIINVCRVELLDATSVGKVLTPFNREQAGYQSLPQYNSVGGTPQWYDKVGKYLYLYPKPNYTLASALTVYFERNKSAFASTDTTKVPGIPTIFHMYLCRMAALPYLMEKGSQNKDDIATMIAIDEAAIMAHFGHRDKDIRTRIQPRIRNPR